MPRSYSDMTRILTILITLSIIVGIRAQDPQYLELVKAETELEQLFNELYSDTLSASDPILTRIEKIMPAILATEGSMDFPWNGLTRIGVVTSDDGNVRIFTWHVMDDPDSYRYFGYIQVQLKKNRVKVYTLLDNGKGQRDQHCSHHSPHHSQVGNYRIPQSGSSHHSYHNH